MFVVYEAFTNLDQSESYAKAAKDYRALQASGEIGGRLVHVFPAEANAVSLEQRLVSELGQEYRPLHPRLVAILEYPTLVSLFGRSCIYGLIRVLRDEAGLSYIQLRLPPSGYLHAEEIPLAPPSSEDPDWFQALHTFVHGGSRHRGYAHASALYANTTIHHTRVTKACAQIQQKSGDLVAAMAEQCLSEVVTPLEHDAESTVNRDLGSLLHLIVEDEISTLRQMGQLGLDFFSLWDNLDVTGFHERARLFCTQLSQVTSLQLMEIEESTESLFLLALDARDAFADLAAPFNVLPILFLKKQRVTDDDLECMRHLLEGAIGTSCKVALLIVFANQSDLKHTRQLLAKTMKQAYAYDIICPSREELEGLASSVQAQDALRHLVLSQIDLSTVSPFVTTGSTPDDMFFGRETELREITEHVATLSYVLIGGRRFGKTSVLKRLERVNLPSAGFRALYHDCSFTPTESELVRAVVADRIWFPQPLDGPPHSLYDIISSLPHSKPLVILLDEADKLLQSDRAGGYPVFNALRASSNMGHCCFVLAGGRAIRSELTDPESPLYNFAQVILMGCLDLHAVAELTTRPMKALEIRFTDEAETVQRIWDLTSGHPNIVQRLCQHLVILLNARGNRRLSPFDVDAVAEDPGFLRKDFLNVYWERATALERICSLMMAADQDLRTLAGLHESLLGQDIQVDLNQVDDALERLVDLRNILQRTAEGYEFAVTAFPDVIAKTARLADWIALNREVYEHHGDVEPHSKRGTP
jgi:hypothetical protein